MRFKPADVNQLADLGDLGFNLSWEPMDESVAAVTTVNYQSADIPWIYTVVPVGTPLPAGIQSEQIAQLFLFNEEDGDAQDSDPWLPNPDPGPAPCTPQWDTSCHCYHDCPVADLSSAATATRRSKAKASKTSRQGDATAKLKQVGISPKALYNEAMRLSGHEDEATPHAEQKTSATAQLSLFGGRYHPRGKIQVQDTELGVIPLRGVEVKSRRWFQFGSAFTDDQGNFAINTSYRSLAKLSLNFKNDLATTRGLVQGIKFWNAVLPISAEIGDYENGDMENVSYTITWQGGLPNQKSKGASVFAAATLFNILAEDRELSFARNIPNPTRGINVWLFPDFPPQGQGSGATPMLRTIATTSLASQVIDFLLIASGMGDLALVKLILQRQLPDISIRYGSDLGAIPTHAMRSLLYHELGHTQHYNMMGNSFWTTYISYIVQHGGYGEKADSGSGLIAVSEGWGNYIERTFVIDKYRNSSDTRWSDRATAELENQVPDVQYPLATSYATGVYGTRGWLAYGLMHDMTDNSEPAFTGITDNVNAFSTVNIYRGLQYGSNSVRAYQSSINSQNAGLQAAQMEQLVTSYQW